MPLPQRFHRDIAGWPLDAAVPAPVIVRAVAVRFPVSGVMLYVVRDQIVQRKSVMAGNEVDADFRLALLAP